MKNVVVLTYTFDSEYTNEVVSGVTDYFEGKDDVRVFITQIRSPDNSEGKFGYQHWNLTGLLGANDIDAYIVLSGSFGDYVKTALRDINPENKPVVSISQDLGFENSVYTVCKPEETFEQVINHLVEKHGCKKIAFMSGRGKNVEAEERYTAFVSAMKKCNQTIDEKLLFDGKYTQSSAEEIINSKYKSKDDINFDALICANDSMAAGSITSLLALGVNIPGDVKVIGFDNSIYTRVTKPTLSSIDQQLCAQGAKAAEIVYKMLEGVKVEKENVIELKPVYRQSCGCVSINENPINCVDGDGNYLEENHNKVDLLQHYNSMNSNNNRISYLFDCVQSKTTLGQYAENLQDIKSHTWFRTISIFLFEEPVTAPYGEKPVFPEKCLFAMEINEEDDIFFNIDNNYFELKEQIFPTESFEHKKGNYIIYPIYSGDEIFGYMICRFYARTFSFYEVCLKLMSHTLSRAKAFTESVTENVNLALDNYSLEEKNIGLHHESRIDELTQVLNRRGFMEEGQTLIDKCLKNNRKGIVFFGDLDGLKTINDNFGHENGDIAIKTEAEILKSTFRDIDVVGRLSGDEFAIVAPEFTVDDAEMIQSVINDSTKEIVQSREIKFPLSISIGYIEFDSAHNHLKDLLAQADKGLYKIKHEKHGEEYFKRKNR